MEKCKILTSKEELGSVAKKVFYETGDEECYKRISIKVDEGLKIFYKKSK